MSVFNDDNIKYTKAMAKFSTEYKTQPEACFSVIELDYVLRFSDSSIGFYDKKVNKCYGHLTYYNYDKRIRIYKGKEILFERCELYWKFYKNYVFIESFNEPDEYFHLSMNYETFLDHSVFVMLDELFKDFEYQVEIYL